MRNRKKPEPPEEEGSPAWMNTYGDMVTLLLTFFVLLFAFSTIDAQKWEEIVSSLSGTPFVAIQALDPGDVKADEQPLDETSWDLPEPTPAPTVMEGMNVEEVKERFNELYEKIKAHIEINGLQDDLNVEMKNNVIVLHMSEAALFDSGRDDLKPAAIEMLPAICEMFVEYDILIETIFVEGHTDTVPIQNAKFQDNDELSAARAVQVKRFMKKVSSINPAKIWPTGLGEYFPIADNSTNEGKARNRRVDFVIESILKNREETQ